MLDYELIHRPGLKHQVPDAISRIVSVHKEEDGELVPIDDDIPTTTITRSSSHRVLDKHNPIVG